MFKMVPMMVAMVTLFTVASNPDKFEVAHLIRELGEGMEIAEHIEMEAMENAYNRVEIAISVAR